MIRSLCVLRHVLAGLAAAAITCSAAADAPMAKGQAPGWYRMPLGSFEVTALLDGTLQLPVDQYLGNIAAADVKRLLAQNHLQLPVETSVNGYLINTGSKLVLIDAGAGTLFGPSLGKLLTNLKASGYQPEQVDEIYITHMHADHVGGITADGRAVFPNAVVRADMRESGHWLDEAKLAAAPAGLKNVFQGAMLSLKPYVDAGRFKPFDGAADLVPGIRALPTHGHTPGHTVYTVESQGRKLVVWGDLMHVAAVQFAVPAATMNFDVDSKAAMPQRQQQYADAAAKGYDVAIAHVSFPGIGRLRADGKGYRWIPANYTTDTAPKP